MIDAYIVFVAFIVITIMCQVFLIIPKIGPGLKRTSYICIMYFLFLKMLLLAKQMHCNDIAVTVMINNQWTCLVYQLMKINGHAVASTLTAFVYVFVCVCFKQ